jgi:hypothetical protein
MGVELVPMASISGRAMFRTFGKGGKFGEPLTR